MYGRVRSTPAADWAASGGFFASATTTMANCTTPNRVNRPLPMSPATLLAVALEVGGDRLDAVVRQRENPPHAGRDVTIVSHGNSDRSGSPLLSTQMVPAHAS